MTFFENNREKDFYRIRIIIVTRLFQEYQSEQSSSKRQWIEAMARSVALTPVEVFPDRRVMSEGVERR